MSKALLQAQGVAGPNGTVSWNWEHEALLDDLDRQCLRERLHPHSVSESRAVEVKRAMSRGVSMAALAAQMQGIQGYGISTLKKYQSALSRAKTLRCTTGGTTENCPLDFELVIKKLHHE